MKNQSQQLCELVSRVECCIDSESFYGELRSAQECAVALLLESGKAAAEVITSAFEQLGTYQRRRRILEALVWPVLDKPAIPDNNIHDQPGFVWLFQVPVTVTLAKECLSTTNLLTPTGLDFMSIAEALVDSQALGEVTALTCWPSLYRREDFYAYGPLQLAQLMVDLFQEGGADSIQPLPVLLDEDYPHARVVTFHLWLGARMSVGDTELLTRKPLESEVRTRLQVAVACFLESQGLLCDSVDVLEPQNMVEGYFTAAPAWQAEVGRTLQLAMADFEVGSVRLQLPIPGFFELVSEEKCILMPPTMCIGPRRTIKEDLTRCVEAAGLTLDAALSRTIPVSALMH